MLCSHCDHDATFRAVKLEGSACSWCGFVHPPQADYAARLAEDSARTLKLDLEATLRGAGIHEEQAVTLGKTILDLVLSRISKEP